MSAPCPTGYEIQYRFGLHHADFLGRLAWQPVLGRKLWVSADGWRIIRPERLTIRDQLRELSSACRIAGEQGSALHSLILLKPARGLRLDVFARDNTLTPHQAYGNQGTICQRRKMDYRFHSIAEERILDRIGPRVRKTYAPPDRYLSRHQAA